MSYYRSGQLDLTERLAIETGLCRNESFKRIAARLDRHPSTISGEVKKNRTHIKSSYHAGKDCAHAKQCAKRELCTEAEFGCRRRCKYCKDIDCRQVCSSYRSVACHRPEHPPYVCNTCKERKTCIKDKFIYTAVYADETCSRRRSESRKGLRLTQEQKDAVNEIITPLVKLGQPLAHIYAEHQEQLPMSLRSIYNYIDSGELEVKNIDLRRKVRYRKRKKGSKRGFANQTHRIGRTYEDYERYAAENRITALEMDTVKGQREKGKRLLTIIFPETLIMLMFLMPDGTGDSVKRVFDYLERGLGNELFKRLFPVILTDNGSEFKRVDDLELDEDRRQRTKLFYCDPMASWQKPHVEKNHEFIRYVLPRGKSLTPYTNEDITLLMNHINSIRRPSLGNRCPYEAAGDDADMKELFKLLKMDLIPSDEVHLKSDLFRKNR